MILKIGFPDEQEQNLKSLIERSIQTTTLVYDLNNKTETPLKVIKNINKKSKLVLINNNQKN